MAIFSKKENTETETAEKAPEQAQISAPVVVGSAGKNGALVVPRLSEKAGSANKLNKYIFTIHGKMNKLELAKTVEKTYGVKIANVNMINVKGKTRRFGRNIGKTSAFKKAIVTLTPDSKKINIVEPS